MSCQAEVTGKDVAAAFFDLPQQINAGDLNIGYVDIDQRGQPVILLHGWPYDIHSYVEVAPAGGKRLPGHCASLRGYGTTRFLSASTPRNGQPSAMARKISLT